MKTNIRSAIAAIGGLLLAHSIAFAGPAAEPQAKDFPGGSPLIIPAAAFNDTGLNPTGSTFNTNGFIGGGSSTTCFMAPVYFPDGARVTYMAATMADMAATDMKVALVRTSNASYRFAAEMASVTSNGDLGPPPIAVTRDTADISLEVVQYPEFSYYLFACLASFEFQLHQVELRYLDEFIFADGFESGARSATAAKSEAPLSDRGDPLAHELAGEALDEMIVDSKNTAFRNPLNISAAEFKPDGFQAGDVFVSPNDGTVYGANYAETRIVHAPIYLPDGAHISSVWARVQDADGGGGGPGNCVSGFPSDIELAIVRKKGCSASTCSDEMARVSTSGSSPNLQTLGTATIDFPVVDGDDYGYFATVRLCGPKHTLYNLHVFYTGP